MRTLTRWTPFREMAQFDPFADFGTFWKDFGAPALRGLETEPMIRMEVTENDVGFTVKAEIPGVRKEDISVAVDGNMVSITAEVKREKEAKEGEKVLRAERYYGSATRTFTLPVAVDLGMADATYDNGMLTLKLPKAPGAESRRLEIH